MNDFILELPCTLPRDFCQEVIRRFDADRRKAPGVTTDGYDPKVKRTIELGITQWPEWKDIDTAFYDNLRTAMEPYHKLYPILSQRILGDHGYHLKCYEPGDFFDWHADATDKSTMARQYIAIWYLNDVEEGGETEFRFTDRKIKPEAGKLVFFPAGWTHEHRGVSPVRGKKYIVSAWLSLI